MILNIQRYSPTVGHCFLLLAAVFVGQIAAGFALTGLPQSVVYAGAMLFPLGLVFVLARESSEEEIPLFCRKRPGGKTTAAIAAVAAMMTLCIIVLIDPLTSLIPMPQVVKDAFGQLFSSGKPADLIISTCIMAPLAEEFLCRGVIMRGLCSRISPRAATLWAAAIFAIMHANPWQAIPAFILGSLFGWAYFKTGRLWVPIALHSLNNLTSCIFSLQFPSLEADCGLLDIMGNSYWIAFGCMLGIFILLVRLMKVILKYEEIISA